MGKAELGNSNNYSATHPLRAYIVSPGREGKLWFSLFLLSAFAESRERCMSKNSFGAERSAPRGLSEHCGQHFHVLL